MIRLPRPIWLAFLAGLCALLLAAPAAGRAGGESQAQTDPFWLGPYYAGMSLSHEARSANGSSFSYGDCELPEGEGGCSVPATVQTASTCERNPIAIDRLPFAIYALRGGGIAAEYESTGVDVGTGAETVTVYARYELMGAALRDVHRQSQTEPEPLPPPVYPLPVLRELKRATVVAAHRHGIGAIAKATGLLPGDVWVRLRVAELLGPDALDGVPAPTMSVRTMERLRQLAFRAQYDFARTAREAGVSKAALRAKIRRVRGLVGYC